MSETTEILVIKQRLERLEEKVFGKRKEYKPVVCNGLMWSEVAEEEMSWDEAKKYARGLKEGGYSDWRLPTVRELQDIFDYEKGKVRIKFGDDDFFWSSTEDSNTSTSAWFVYLYFGSAYYTAKTTSYAVRCVRRDK